MIDVILSENTRPAAGDQLLSVYSMGAVVSAIAAKGMDVRCIDFMSDLRKDSSEFLAENSSEVCCYSVFFGNKVSAFRRMADARRSKNPPRLIIAFGPFAAAFPEEILVKGLADIVVDHDPEFVIPAILHNGGIAPSLETIANLSYMCAGEVVHTPRSSFQDLDQGPFISPFLYNQGYRPALMMTARGCRNHCIFCDRNALWGGGIRNRSIDNVIKEIKELVEIQHAPEIQFLDENLLADHQRFVALCKGIRQVQGKFYWNACACIDSVNKKILLLMKHSRCRNIYFGIESASQRVLQRIGKTYGRKEILDAVRWSKEAGLGVGVMITAGNPGEGDLDRKLTLATLNELGPSVEILENRLVILPGTPFFYKGLREGWFTRQSYFEDEGSIFYDEGGRKAGSAPIRHEDVKEAGQRQGVF